MRLEESNQQLLDALKQVIITSRSKAFQAVNSNLLECYWNIGRLIIEDEQQGNARAQYGKFTLRNISIKLSEEFGKGFDERNMYNMRSFYTAFPIWNAVRTELSWTHYRWLSRVDDYEKRN
jgi:hypothetical protein